MKKWTISEFCCFFVENLMRDFESMYELATPSILRLNSNFLLKSTKYSNFSSNHLNGDTKVNDSKIQRFFFDFLHFFVCDLLPSALTSSSSMIILSSFYGFHKNSVHFNQLKSVNFNFSSTSHIWKTNSISHKSAKVICILCIIFTLKTLSKWIWNSEEKIKSKWFHVVGYFITAIGRKMWKTIKKSEILELMRSFNVVLSLHSCKIYSQYSTAATCSDHKIWTNIN